MYVLTMPLSILAEMGHPSSFFSPCSNSVSFNYCFQIKSGHGKGPAEFEKLRILQDLSGEHVVCTYVQIH